MTTAVADARPFTVDLPDGRVLQAFEAGDPGGKLIVVHHGTPASGLLDSDAARDAARRGIRLVGYDRAGYGGSTRDPGRTVASIAADIAALADSLGAERFWTWGASGGGPHTLACAALLPDRVAAAATIASVAPYRAVGLDFLDGMGRDNLDEFGAALEGEDVLRGYLDPQRTELLEASAGSLGAAMESLLPPVDKAFLTGAVAEYFVAAMAHGLRDSCDGWLDDDFAFIAPWGFDLAEIRVPVYLLQGDQDLMVPFAHGRWLADAVPAPTASLLPGEGHLSLLARVPDVHAWLLSHS